MVFGDSRKLLLEVEMRGQDKVNKALGNVEKRGEGTASKIGAAFKRLGPLIAAGIAVGAAAIVVDLAKIGIQAAETRNLVSASFKDMTQAAVDWSKTSSAALVNTKLELQAQAAQLFNIAKGMNTTKKVAFDLATGYTELAADLASFNNMRPEEVFERLRAAMTGEFESLKTLGIVINEAVLKHEVLERATEGVNIDLGNMAEKAQLIYEVIKEKAEPAIGDLARTAAGAANQIKILETKIRETKEELGERMVPVTAEWLTIVNELADKALPKVIERFQALTALFKKDMSTWQKAMWIYREMVGDIYPGAPMGAGQRFPKDTGKPWAYGAPQPTLQSLYESGKLMFPPTPTPTIPSKGAGGGKDGGGKDGGGPSGTATNPLYVRLVPYPGAVAGFMGAGEPMYAGFLAGAKPREGYAPSLFPPTGVERLRLKYMGAMPTMPPEMGTFGFRPKLRYQIREEQQAFAARVQENRRAIAAGMEAGQGVPPGQRGFGAVDWPSVMAAGAMGAMTGGVRGFAQSALPMIGAAFGPWGAAAGSILASLLGRKRKQPVITEPIPVRIVNWDGLGQLLNITKGMLVGGASRTIDRLNELRMRQVQVPT